MTPINRKILRDLWRIKGQALAIALVIGSGVATYIMSLGTLYSLEETRDAYYERYRFAQVFAPLKRAPQRLKADIADIAGVKTVETRIVKNVTLDIPGLSEPASGRLISLPETREQTLNVLHLRQGRLLAPGRPDEVLVNEAFALANEFKPGNTFAAIINGHKRTLTIVGVVLSPEYVYALGPGALMPDDQRFGIIWMEEKALEAAFDLGGSFTEASMTLERGVDASEVIAALDRMTEKFGGIRAYAQKDQISNWFVTNEINQLRAMGNVAPPLFLGIAAFLLHIVASRLVETERQQIGLLKAFGYSDGNVAWLYIKLVLIIVIFGIVTGLAFGTWLGRGMTELYTEYFRFPFLYYIIDGSIYITATLISITVGLAGALTSVWRAQRLMPAVAMTPPPPTSYQTFWVERLLRLKTLSEPSRMILRHSLRWPLRSGLSVLGTALAVAILISTIFFLDSMDRLVNVQFFQTQRQDVMLHFADAKSASSLSEVARLPGVLISEPFRSVPTRLVAGHWTNYENIIGLASDASMFRPLGDGFKPMKLPAEGLVLSKKMAEVLHVGLGDIITVEVKEGRRPVLKVPVTALVDEYIATPVYMDLAALNRLLGEDPVITGATLRIDKTRAAELYRELKDMPSVAAVSIREVLVESFRKTINDNLGLMIDFNIAFASIIAFGVVYNSARISLSERSRELASLRVLGFTRGEAAYILLGELALLIVAALPLGSGIGYGLASLWAESMNTELFRIPLVLNRDTFALAIVVVLVAAAISGLVVRRKLDTMDLVEALKTRE
ncbi:MAG: FtsX-like permease family protein [Rhodospirillaceae bacterium]|jgi:putative ABC transport system permease protein|nr:FtsX-like permease family protein [Rhodospirillaceae bacterium]MBT5245882.1 FtsX-like permease family protein [Rhodospirillaceae bacterium]MBT5562401.1 FtsX-like permease family protein [Rhodospirillaceae bacterium]MBT6241073.1 FtsX-like permease family protein [Rhodospirillaceae bacterium]MBT7138074.1 FtsX-like permease family protein [Rhodospirillaceae bacterium]